MSMDQERAKIMLAREAAQMFKPKMTIGLGAGTTVMKLVESLKNQAHQRMNIIVASLSTQEHCQSYGIDAQLMRHCSHIDLYIDGADEVDPSFCCIKGRGGAMTGEMLCAEMADEFVVLIDETKQVSRLGAKWPVVALEVVPWARSSVGRSIVKMGAKPHLREKKSDMGNDIIDCHGLCLATPYELANKLSQMTGVVGHGIFVHTRPHRVMVSDGSTVWEMDKEPI